MAELADALALGASVTDVQVQVLSPAPYRVFITKLSFVRTLDTFLSLSFINILLFMSKFSALSQNWNSVDNNRQNFYFWHTELISFIQNEKASRDLKATTCFWHAERDSLGDNDADTPTGFATVHRKVAICLTANRPFWIPYTHTKLKKEPILTDRFLF